MDINTHHNDNQQLKTSLVSSLIYGRTVQRVFRLELQLRTQLVVG